MAQRKNVVILRHGLQYAFAHSRGTILLVVADTHYNSDVPKPRAQISAERTKSRFGGEFIHVVDAIFNVIRRSDVLQLELRFRSFEFSAHCTQNRIVSRAS